jgi:hypothetical protein
LRQRIWPENTLVDYELALKKAVNRFAKCSVTARKAPASSRPSLDVATAS